MKTKYYISVVVLMLLNIFAISAQTNTLTIPDVTAAPGKTIYLPVCLDNTADVVAVQFTLTMPEGITLQPSAATLTERADGHTVKMQAVGRNEYMAMIFSQEGKAIKGRTGKLMSVPLCVTAPLEENTEHGLVLSGVVIGAANGDNLATDFGAGRVLIAKSPDLEVSAVNMATATANPGGKINVSWQVSNVGGQPTGAGWSEQVFLDGANGASKLLVTTHYDEVLSQGGVVSRQAEIDLPKILGIDGKAAIRVKLTPNSETGEPAWLRDNNTASSSATIGIGKILQLSPTLANVEEASKQNIRFYLQRSGSTATDETFTLTGTADSRVTLPETVTIAKGQSGVYFYAQVKANGVLDDNDVVALKISGNGYEEVEATLNIEDDTFPSLVLTSSAQDVEEGKTITFTIKVESAPTEDLEIKLACDFLQRFNIPSVVLPAGQTSVDVTVEAKQDDVPDVEEVVTFTASAAGYNPASLYVVLVDDDVPMLQLTLTPDAVSEAAGPLAVVAKLRRIDNINKVVTVKFSDDSDGAIYYGRQTVEMAAGVEEVTVNLGPIDNAIVDGERTYNISAAVWIASCRCSANNGTSGGVVTVPLTIYDNDGPALSLTSSSSVVKEGGETEITVSRNTETFAALEVNISSDHDSALEYPKTVIIPAGETSATFVVKSVKNDVNGDSFTTVMTVESDGFAKANVWFMVSDQTLPDAQITSIEVSETEVEVGTDITVTVTLTNTGSYELPELTKVGFYHSGSSTALATAYLQAPLAAGGNVTLSKTISLPDAVGTYNVYVVANDGQAVKELLYTNNTSSTVAVATCSPYTFTIQTNKKIYMPGETVYISGCVNGKDVKCKEIDIYIVNGIRQTIKAYTDGNGNFSATWTPYSLQAGHFILGACYPNEDTIEEQASIDIYGMGVDVPTKGIEPTVNEEYTAFLNITNIGSLDVTGLTAVVASKPDNCEISLSIPETIKAGASVPLAYTIMGTVPTEGRQYEKIIIDLSTSEGVTAKATLYFFCHPKYAYLKSEVVSINTNMTVGEEQTYPIEIANYGKGETGEISVLLPENASWMSLLTPQRMPSLENTEKTTIILSLKAKEDMQLNIPVKGTIVINCENGSGLSIPFSIQPVSEKTGTATVDITDEFTFYTAEAPHVAGARIFILHPTTGALIAQGVTDENGLFACELPAGNYGVRAEADKHQSATTLIQVAPGRNNEVKMFLSYQSVIYSWNVVETEVEDKYEIVTNVEYETRVPAPVVVVEFPKEVPYMDHVFVIPVTNKGLITAHNINIILPEEDEYMKFEVLDSDLPVVNLAPQQSVFIPVKVTVKQTKEFENTMYVVNDGVAQNSEDRKTPVSKVQSRVKGDLPPGCFPETVGISYEKPKCDPKTGKPFYDGEEVVVQATYYYGNCYGGHWAGGSISTPYGSIPYIHIPSVQIPNIGSPSLPQNDINIPGKALEDTRIYNWIMYGCVTDCEKKVAKKYVDCIIGFIPIFGCAKGGGG